LASSPPPHFRRSASPSPSVSHSCVFLVFWRQQVVKTVGAGTKTSKQGPSCPPPDPYKRNKTHKKHVFCLKIVFFKNASRIIFASQLLSVFCGFWQAIWRTPKIKRPSFGEKRGGGSENTRFFCILAFFRKSVFFKFRGRGKRASGAPKSHQSRLYISSVSDKHVFFTVFLRFRFRREM
jgi:hypothetical protein